MIFCIDCNNLLTTVTNDNELKFVCKTCLKEYKSVPEDTMMLSVNLKESVSVVLYLKIHSELYPTKIFVPLVCSINSLFEFESVNS